MPRNKNPWRTRKPSSRDYQLYDFARSKEQAEKMLEDLAEGQPVAHKSTSEGGEYNIYVRKGSVYWRKDGGSAGGGEIEEEKRKLAEAIKHFEDKIKSQGMITNARDEEHLSRLKEIRQNMAKGGGISRATLTKAEVKKFLLEEEGVPRSEIVGVSNSDFNYVAKERGGFEYDSKIKKYRMTDQRIAWNFDIYRIKPLIRVLDDLSLDFANNKISKDRQLIARELKPISEDIKALQKKARRLYYKSMALGGSTYSGGGGVDTYKDFYQSQGGIKFKTEEEAKKFIKETKPYVRKQLKEGNLVLVFNGQEYFIGEKINNEMYAVGGEIKSVSARRYEDLDYIDDELGKRYYVEYALFYDTDQFEETDEPDYESFDTEEEALKQVEYVNNNNQKFIKEQGYNKTYAGGGAIKVGDKVRYLNTECVVKEVSTDSSKIGDSDGYGTQLLLSPSMQWVGEAEVQKMKNGGSAGARKKATMDTTTQIILHALRKGIKATEHDFDTWASKINRAVKKSYPVFELRLAYESLKKKKFKGGGSAGGNDPASKVKESELDLGHMYSYDINDENGISLYKEHNVYFIVGFRNGNHFNYGFDKFSDAKSAYREMIKMLKTEALIREHEEAMTEADREAKRKEIESFDWENWGYSEKFKNGGSAGGGDIKYQVQFFDEGSRSLSKTNLSKDEAEEYAEFTNANYGSTSKPFVVIDSNDVRWIRKGEDVDKSISGGIDSESDMYEGGGGIGVGAYILTLQEDAHNVAMENGFDSLQEYLADLDSRGIGYAEYDEREDRIYTHSDDVVDELMNEGIAYKTYGMAKGGGIGLDSVKATKQHFGFDDEEWNKLSRNEQDDLRLESYKQLQLGKEARLKREQGEGGTSDYFKGDLSFLNW